MGEQEVIIPPVLYLPVQRAAETTEEPRVIVGITRSGERALFAFTALDRLVAHCGARTPWILLPVDALALLQEETGFSVLILDQPVPGITGTP
ncbi:SAV_915 family protein [Mycetocola saprophilus]|uniref:SAV_915 family protein n=1 Tax=Mycetocola saprophilus TaxID=76636 RepID=UPI0005BB840C|nr:SAV_915 family protein [Mycetocola saprophilus]